MKPTEKTVAAEIEEIEELEARVCPEGEVFTNIIVKGPGPKHN